ncbi:MAG TPA: hypothetical protein VLV48_02400 [Thermoanaerobaculia bacterium]|nr:hypothetical protein [Thermoanaerobaculia bacterium]
MANDSKRPHADTPQSYGSDRDWLEGTTAQTVENTPSRTTRHDESFYDSRHESTESSATEAPAAPGVQAAQGGNPARATGPATTGGKKVPESNATRQSYFRNRDYD